jgi:superfamily II DNA or RNA helicase
MARLEDIVQGAKVEEIDPKGPVEIVSTTWYGSDTLEIVYRDSQGRPQDRMLYRHDEPLLRVQDRHRHWGFDADPALTRLAAEAQRIRLAYNFDPLLAIHSSDVDPLPHQITAVYESMLPRQPLRFLLADDPGAGKTIMTGLFMKELYLRGDLDRCLIVCPGSLAEQWQDELDQKFDLPFEIYTNDQAEASRTGNWFSEHDLVICRLDQLSRNEDLQDKLSQTDWDLVVVDEAHKMSASYFGDELKKTQRYQLGELLGRLARHFLLLSATPHNGKEADFQLFMALLDGDRFEGKYRQAVHTQKADDLMRRMVKEQLVQMDGRPLFPERHAYTVTYDLSDKEAILYEEVSKYVRDEFDRAENIGDGNRKGNVGFALTVLQRRLASSPEAIYQSLVRRHDRLKTRLDEERINRQAGDARLRTIAVASRESLDDIDEGLATDFEIEEDELADRTTAAMTLRELEAEIATLERLVALADDVRKSGLDKKWEQLSAILQERVPQVEDEPTHRKLVIFTEHRDTLHYLQKKISNLIGRPEAIVAITGGMSRDDRRKAQEAFTQDKSVEILLATDAAGEGINLQRAHLMVNYDLPWNPNRLEQRFGRIHRIGQREVCHLWNLVAHQTREGAVYRTLLVKLEQEREALGGKVFDVLGSLKFGENETLKDLLVKAIRYGDRPDVRERLNRVIDGAVNTPALEKLLAENALHTAAPSIDVREVAEAMERANARRLQPHYIASFFREAFAHLGGNLKPREEGRFEISHVPGILRQRGRAIGRGAPLLDRFERITFDCRYRYVDGRPTAAFVAPGHPLLDTTIDVILERYRMLLRQGTIFVDTESTATDPRVLCLLEHEITDGRTTRKGDPITVSKRMQFVELGPDGTMRDAGPAPYLDYRPPTDGEAAAIAPLLDDPWLTSDLESVAVSHAIGTVSPKHLAEVRDRTERLVDRTIRAVHDRLTHEINYWDLRYVTLQDEEAKGKKTRLSSEMAKRRRDDLQRRLEERTRELELQKRLAPRKPVLKGAMLVVPAAMLTTSGDGDDDETPTAEERRRIELVAMEAVMRRERALGNEPRDVSRENVGYDIESRVPGVPPGTLRMIEVKGRVAGSRTVTVTRNEILTAKNSPDKWILALVEVDDDETDVTYLIEPFRNLQDPDFSVASVNFLIDRIGN